MLPKDFALEAMCDIGVKHIEESPLWINVDVTDFGWGVRHCHDGCLFLIPASILDQEREELRVRIQAEVEFEDVCTSAESFEHGIRAHVSSASQIIDLVGWMLDDRWSQHAEFHILDTSQDAIQSYELLTSKVGPGAGRSGAWDGSHPKDDGFRL